MWAMISSFGINWAGLSYSSSLLLRLCIWGTVSYVGLMLALDGIELLRRRYGYENSLAILEESKLRNARLKRLVNSWIPPMAMLIVGYVLGSAQIFSPVRELHGVEVISKNGERTYTLKFPEVVTPVVIKLCPEGDNLPLVAGMILDPFQYIQEDSCLLINGRTYVDWRRDTKQNIVDKQGKILFAREE